GGVGVHVRGGRVQSGADAEPEDELSWGRMSQRSSVSVLAKTRARRPTFQTLTLSRVDSIKIRLWNSSKNAVFPQPARLIWRSRSNADPEVQCRYRIL